MVVCALQSFATEQQLNSCSVTKSPKTTQMMKDTGIVDNGNGAEEDREEGEIVDEYEMIISSEDEEFKLRARIKQLEDNSKDIEKMEMLSANLANQYNYQRPPRIEKYMQYQNFSPISVLSDVSSMSEEEVVMVPKKNRRHKIKRSESKKHWQLLRRNPFAPRIHSQSDHTKKKRRQDNYYQPHKSHQQTILVDSLDSVTDDEDGEYDLNVENENDDYENLEQLKLSRNKLRVALARAGNSDIKPKHSLKERLQYRMRKSPSPLPMPAEKELKCNKLPPNSFEGYSQLEKVNDHEEDQDQHHQESLEPVEEPPEIKLRLIALKSAILKKHLARKKRDAERAYSPTDMINRVHPPTISNECDDIDDLMEISPAASPDRTAYSPPPAEHFEEPVDMDLAQTDSDEDKQQWPQNWQSEVNSGGSWRCFLPNSLPPVSMPIVVDEEDETEQQDQRLQEQFDDEDDEVPPPPPPFHIPHMQLEDDDARDALHLSEQQNSHHGSYTDIQSISMENSQTQIKSLRSFQQESSDDEAGALRAILLSKLKPSESGSVKKAQPIQVPAIVNFENKSEAPDSDDPEELRLLLLSSIASKKKSSKDDTCGESPEILKNAVRRFQISSLMPNQGDELPSTVEPAPETATVPLQMTLSPTVEVPLPDPLPVPPPQLPLETTELSPAHTPAPSLPQAIPLPTTDIIKIVKPNKVINKKTAPKRKISKLAESEPLVKRPTALVVKEIALPQKEEADTGSTRLITTLNPASIKVNKLVITLAESSAGSDDELEFSSTVYSSYIGYADNQSPLSQAIESASNSTTRSNTPNSEIIESTATSSSNLRRTVINEYFEKKLDDFLKQARSKVTPVTTATPLISNKLTQEPTGKESDQQAKLVEKPVAQKTKPTPVAVRHLPVASQKEYLQLIERMQLLEKKKLRSRKAVTVTADNATESKLVKRITSALSKGNSNSNSSSSSSSNINENLATTTKVEAIKNGSNTEDTNSNNLATTSVMATKAAQPSKENRLKAFENSFFKIGGSMITNLDKSLTMVEEAKKSKIARLRYSRRLEDLMVEVQAVKQAVKMEEAKLARIQPEIQASHEIIISLKQKRNKLRNAALDLGKGLKGPDYRLLDPGKAEIIQKSTQLTKDIRLYNSIVKYKDIPEEVDDPTSIKSVQSETEPPPDLDQHSEHEPSLQTDPSLQTEPSLQTVPSLQTAPAIAEQSSQPSKLQHPEKEISTEIEQEPQQRLESSDVTPSEHVSLATEEDAVRKKIQLDVDTLPRNGAMLHSCKEMDVPPYPVGRMRELCEPPYGKSLLGEYRTPMPQNYNRHLNINATVCPFELMGRCEDADCSYLHLTRESTDEKLGRSDVSAVEQ